jgi:tetratricopeptide (TPR) repeat protein
MNLRLAILVVAFSPAIASVCPAQTVSSHTTVRHHHEADDASNSAEIAQAESAMSKKDYASAEKTLLAVTTANPNNFRAWFDLGFVYNATGRPSDSIDAYRKSVAANPQIFESTLNLGLMLAKAGDPEAEKYLRLATALKPSAHQEDGWYRAWVSLGHVLETSKPQEAIEAFQNAAKLQPKEIEPHISAGFLLEGQKQYQQAAAEYRKAAEIDPKSVQAVIGIVNADSKAGQMPDAEAALRKLIALQPDNATAHVQLGRVLAAEQKADEATAELEKGLQLQPGDPAVERQLASIYLDQNKYNAAAPYVESALKASPNDAQLHHWMGRIYLEQKKFPQAQNELIAALKLKPDMGVAYGDLAFAANENKEYVLVIKALDARAKFLPELPMTYFLRATAYDHLHDEKDAAANYHKFLDQANGKFPDEEWKATHRLVAIEPKK